MENNPKPGIYKHFKGNNYEVIGVVRHSETLEDVVLYKALYGERALWVRPLAMFTEAVMVGGKRVPRFRLMEKRKFVPRPGQIDYTNVHWAPVINCVVQYRGNILLVRRSKTLESYPGYWNGVSGFLDDDKSLADKVREELSEELGIPRGKIKRMHYGEIFDREDARYKKTWIVHPVLVEVATNKVKLDWEAEAYRWITIREAKRLKLLPGFNTVLKNLSPWLKSV